jgi:peptidoglycan/LPS O-acetylase OafA/YrhL/lysophospholipase L1-like esterase
VGTRAASWYLDGTRGNQTIVRGLKRGMRWYVAWAQSRDRELHYRADLDGLRGIAILAVVGFHAFPAQVPGGFVGVDVFFVLSGFLISTIILKQLRSSTFTLGDFYVRRARRLFPALAVVLATCLLLGWFVLLPDELKNLGKHIGAAAAFILNFSVWREGGYFDPAQTLNPVLHLWSLGIEEQFYLVWPVVLLLLWQYKRGLGAVVGTLVVVSFIANIVFAHTDPRGDFYLPVTRFWELGLGCLLAIVPPLRSPGRALGTLGIVLTLAAIFLFDAHMAFPGWAALIPAAGALCIICAGPDDWLRKHALTARPLVFTGIISYPLYLWHWPLLSFATILGSGPAPARVRAAIVLLSFLLAYLVFRFVELPIRMRSPLHTSSVLAAGLGTLGVAGLIVFSASGLSSRFGHDVGHDVRALTTASRINHFCLNVFPGKEDFNYCKGTSDESPEVVFLGDSRTQAVYDAMVSLSHASFPMMLLARGGCPPVLNARSQESARQGHGTSCDATWHHFVDAVHRLRPRLVVVVGGGSDLVQAENPQGGDVEFKQGLSDLLRTLLQAETDVVYVRETPVFDTGPDCFLRPVKVPWGACAPVLPRATVESRLAAYNRAVDEVAAQVPALVVVDSMQALCGAKYCAQKLRSGELLYRDALHLTSAGARRLNKGSGLYAIIDKEIRETPSQEWR